MPNEFKLLRLFFHDNKNRNRNEKKKKSSWHVVITRKSPAWYVDSMPTIVKKKRDYTLLIISEKPDGHIKLDHTAPFRAN